MVAQRTESSFTGQSLSLQIETHIHSAVLEGRYKPGERLVETAIAEQLGVSRAPVREALAGLERTGIVVYRPRRGHFVIDFTDDDIDDIYDLRTALEVCALQRTIERISEADLQDFQRLVNRIDEAAHQEAETVQMAELDLLFHERICQIAHNSRLFSAWNSMRLQTFLLIVLTSRTHQGYPDQHRRVHQQILDALTTKDLRVSEQLLREHLFDARQRARRALKQLHAAEIDRAT